MLCWGPYVHLSLQMSKNQVNVKLFQYATLTSPFEPQHKVRFGISFSSGNHVRILSWLSHLALTISSLFANSGYLASYQSTLVTIRWLLRSSRIPEYSRMITQTWLVSVLPREGAYIVSHSNPCTRIIISSVCELITYISRSKCTCS